MLCLYIIIFKKIYIKRTIYVRILNDLMKQLQERLKYSLMLSGLCKAK